MADLCKKTDLLAELTEQGKLQPETAPALLEALPTTRLDVSRLPEAQRRRPFDAFHLEVRYDDRTSELDLRVTITGDTATMLRATVQEVLDSAGGTPEPVADQLRAPAGHTNAADLQGARGGSRTRTPL
ncbi:hypothetical protein [Actinoplanes sp. NPDC051411]|uniref:hypothetical protein n=1 Tax=Actinoplanes sp. NPDC051411 TaxID=3155522 RepID=UPI0034318360